MIDVRFPQFPRRVPDHGAEAPAAVMSAKSQSLAAASVPTVKVRAVPVESDFKRLRRMAEPPESVNVPVIV